VRFLTTKLSNFLKNDGDENSNNKICESVQIAIKGRLRDQSS